MACFPLLFARLAVSGRSHIGSRACPTGENVTFLRGRLGWRICLHCSHSACHRHSAGQGMGRTLPPKRPHKSVIVSRSPRVSQVPLATNGGGHRFNKNDNNWLHKHFEPEQVDVVVSSISILGLESLSAFARIHPLTLHFSDIGPIIYTTQTFLNDPF